MKHAGADPVGKWVAKFGRRAVNLADPRHEFPLLDALRQLKQTQSGDVHRRFTGLEVQEPRVEEL